MEQTALESPKGGDKVKTGAKNRYAVHGVPEPLGVNVNQEHMEKAAKILKSGTRDNRVLVKYLRDKGREVRLVGKDENGNLKTYTTTDKGEPYGVLVAFKDGNDVFVGWSKRNSGYAIGEDSQTGKKIWVAEEPLRFTKKDALWVAVLRALTDKITKPEGEAYQTSKKTVIPRQIARQLDKFVARAEKYFGQTPRNLDY